MELNWPILAQLAVAAMTGALAIITWANAKAGALREAIVHFEAMQRKVVQPSIRYAQSQIPRPQRLPYSGALSGESSSWSQLQDDEPGLVHFLDAETQECLQDLEEAVSALGEQRDNAYEIQWKVAVDVLRATGATLRPGDHHPQFILRRGKAEVARAAPLQLWLDEQDTNSWMLRLVEASRADQPATLEIEYASTCVATGPRAEEVLDAVLARMGDRRQFVEALCQKKRVHALAAEAIANLSTESHKVPQPGFWWPTNA